MIFIPCHKVNLLLADTATLLAFYTLYFHTKYSFSMPDRDTPYISLYICCQNG